MRSSVASSSSRFLPQHRFARARLLLGEDQALLLALQVADVDVHDEVHLVRSRALDDADPAAPGQRQLERGAGVAQALRQRGDAAREQRLLGGCGVLPCRPVGLVEGQPDAAVRSSSPYIFANGSLARTIRSSASVTITPVGQVVESLGGFDPCRIFRRGRRCGGAAARPGEVALSRAIGFQIRIRPTPGSGSEATQSLTP
jgi:hypothetical protein